MRYIYQSKLDKVCFQRDMAYGDFKGLIRITASDKILCDKAFNININRKYDGYQRRIPSIDYRFFDKKIRSETLVTRDKSATGGTIKNEHM